MVTIALTLLSGSGCNDDLHARGSASLGGDDIERLSGRATGRQRGSGAHVHPVGDTITAGGYRLGIESDHLGGGVGRAEAEDPALTGRRAAVDVEILAGNDVGIGRYACGHARR